MSPIHCDLRVHSIFLDHHQAHAWSAYSCSPFNDAIILTADGRGDLKSTTISVANKENGVKEIDYLLTFDSLGFLYAQVTNYLGFKPHRHEGKVTGLAAFGNPEKTLPIFKKMISWNEISNQWVTNLNLYAPHNINTLNSFKKILNPFSREDIAAGVQKHCEDLIVLYVKYWIKKLGKDSPKNICLAGGLFANVKINQCISEIEGVKNIFVFPNMGDGGLTVGGVCYQNFVSNKESKINFPTANIIPPLLIHPKKGVYVVKVQYINKYINGIANFGIRPTIDGKKLLLEVNLFDFNQDIYGKELTVEFLTFIRDEKKFNNFSLLSEQIKKDIQLVKAYHSKQ